MKKNELAQLQQNITPLNECFPGIFLLHNFSRTLKNFEQQ